MQNQSPCNDEPHAHILIQQSDAAREFGIADRCKHEVMPQIAPDCWLPAHHVSTWLTWIDDSVVSVNDGQWLMQ